MAGIQYGKADQRKLTDRDWSKKNPGAGQEVCPCGVRGPEHLDPQHWLAEFWHTGKHKRVPFDLGPRLLRKMDMLNRARAHKDLKAPPANHLHALHGDREGQWAISVSGAWRLCFRFEAGDIYDLELVQYH